MFRFGDPGGRAYGSLGTSNVNILAWWTNVNIASSGALSIVSGGGRNTGSCLRFNNGGVNQGTASVSKNLDSQPTWGGAFALKINSLPVQPIAFTVLNDGITSQCDLRLNADGSLSVTRAGTILGTTASLVGLNSWNHIEWKITIHPTAGAVALYFNGVQKINLSSQNTRSSSNSSANIIYIGLTGGVGSNTNTNYDFDDIIIYDGQTNDLQGNADIVGPIGDCALAWLLPTGAGTTTQFTPDSGSNYARVNETTPDDDTSYVADATVNDIDTYSLADLGGTVATVKSIMTAHYARKDDTGTRTFVSEIRTASTNYVGSTINGLSTSYQYYFNGWGSNPNSLAAWSVSDINGLEIGQKVNS